MSLPRSSHYNLDLFHRWWLPRWQGLAVRRILADGGKRFACRVIGQNRSAFRKKKPDMGFEEARLRRELRAVAGKHPAWGWRKARGHLLAQPAWHGVALNRKRVRRLWRDEGLACKPRARKKRRAGPGAREQKRLCWTANGGPTTRV